MALKSTVYKATVNLADMDRGVYLDQSLTLAQHPSETDERMMLRILAWSLNAVEGLEFTKGLCVDDEPEIWKKNYSDEIELWIELGNPDEKWLRKASSRAQQVILYTYGDNAAPIWWQQNKSKLSRFENLQVWNISDAVIEQLAQMTERTMQIQVTIQDGTAWFNCGDLTAEVRPERWN
ncbi:YaeQ family protein [Oceanospirillum sanctuarii]|uniref:YaeQ family protein n=1 Tax=Oceanospirillum sanctuarii TaxID=1434821 RepID=UPI000A3829A4|nr:YaeQ family protein [Oceanospirillum sanctuarii]